MHTVSLSGWILLVGITLLSRARPIFSSVPPRHQSLPNIEDNSTFDWNTIEAKKHIQFVPCYGDFECARLDVPMNHDRTDGKGSRVAIAVTRYPAKVAVTDPRYGGAILTNPGGPGASGVKFAVDFGKALQKIVDASEIETNGKLFDIVSWDPRGVVNTSPPLVCFPHIQDKLRWQHVTESLSFPRPDDGTLDFRLARQMALATSCSSRLVNISSEEDSLIENMNTAAVVGDMVSIVEALGEWREEQAKQLLWTEAATTSKQIPVGLSSEAKNVLARTKWKKGEEKLLYIGLSYGTILGSTFAAMEPERVGRIVIDGVVNMKDYYETQLNKWTLTNTDKTFDGFFKLCAMAGSKCPFNKPNATPEDLKVDYQYILNNLTARPMSFHSTSDDMFDVLTAQNLRNLIFKALYFPLALWNEIAVILRDLRDGDGSSLYISKAMRSTPANWCPSGSCGNTSFSPTCKQGWEIDKEVTLAIIATDADLTVAPLDHPLDKVVDWLVELWNHNENLSSVAGEIIVGYAIGAVGWKGQPKRVFKVPDQVETAHPLLIMNPTWDPVCPLANAYATAKRFVGSVVLEQKSYGHCTLSGPSMCSAKVTRNYFQTGELPAPGTVCDVNELPFIGAVDHNNLAGFVTAQTRGDDQLLEALNGLRNSVVPLL